MEFLSFLTQKVRSLNIRQVFKLKYLLPLLIGASPALAFADNLFTVPDGDISVRVLSALFGGLIENTSGVKADPLMEAIKMFNGSVLIIGGILAAYTILAGTLGTAHDGEMLGKKFSSVWIPIRYSVGTALVLPIVGGGYCVMQAIVMWLVLQGIGLADQVWGAFMGNPTTTANNSATLSSRTDIVDVAKSAYRASICYRAYAKIANPQNGDVLNLSQYKYSMQKFAGGYRYGDASSSLRSNGCGEILYPKALAAPDAVANNQNTKNENVGYLGIFSNIFAQADVSGIHAAHIAQTDLLVQKMDKLAEQTLAAVDSDTIDKVDDGTAAKLFASIQQAAQEYTDNVRTAAVSVTKGNGYEEINKKASEQGWILAGAWFTRIIQMNERIQGAINSLPTSNSNSPGVVDGTLFADATKYLRSVDTVLSKGESSVPTDTFGTEDKRSWLDRVKTMGVGDMLNRLESYVTEGVTKMNLYELKNDSRHPLIVLHDLGSRIVIGTIGLMSLIAGGAALLSAVPVVGNVVPSILTVVQMFMGLPIQAIMTIALGCQYILPNLPYVIWIGCIVGWVLLVVEAIIAAPLWAIMHLHPNGDDLTGRGGNGYMLVLSLLLRPVLMVFGIMASIVISSVIGEFINKTFFEVFANNTGTFTGFSALLALTMGTFLYFTVMFTFIRKCFSIVHMLPDQLLKWIGGGGGGLGEFANEFNGAAERASGAAAGLAGGIAGKVGNRGLENLSGKMQQLNKQASSGEGVEDKGVDGFLMRNSYAITGQRGVREVDNGDGTTSSTFWKGNGAKSATEGNGINADGSDNQKRVLRNDMGNRAYSEQKAQYANKKNSEARATENSLIDAQAGQGAAALAENAAQEYQQHAENATPENVAAFKQAYVAGLISSAAEGGTAARNEFASGVSQGIKNGSIGGKLEKDPAASVGAVAQNIKQDAISNYNNDVMGSDHIVDKTGHINGASQFIMGAAMGSDGKINKQKARMFANSIEKAENIVGIEKTEEALAECSQYPTSKEQTDAFGEFYNSIKK